MDARQRQEEQIRKRVACEERAFHVVLRLLDNPITEDYLKDAGQFITPSHYADVVEERSIAKLCGYPVCGNTLGSVPKQRYRISTKSNTVYDITERKKFCSNFCFKASQFLEKQIATSPVWSRDKEERVNFELLKIPEKSCSVGDEVFLPLPRTEIKKEIDNLEKLDRATSSKQKNTRKSESSVEEHPPVDGDERSNLLSDIVDRMANVKVSYTGEVDGINVDFSEVSGEVTLKDPEVDEIDSANGASNDSIKCDSVSDSKTVSEYDDDESHKELTGNSSDDEKDCITGKRDNDKTQGTEARVCSKIDEDSKTARCSQGQLPGESKQDYVMRLLNRKKNLLGQLADIQQTELQHNKAESVGEVPESKDINTNSDVVDSDDEDSISLNQSVDCTVAYKDKDGDQAIKNTDSPGNQSKQEIVPKEPLSDGQVSSPSPTEKTTSKSSSLPPSVKLRPLNAVAKVMEEWVTRDTLKYLSAGENEDSAPLPADYERNYTELCRRVSKEEKDFDNLLGEESVEDSAASARRPLPDYRKLERETRDTEMRVREFYKGSQGGKSKMDKDLVRVVQLPVVDSHDQMTIRRKIVLDRLDKAIPDLLLPLQLSIQDVSHLVRELVYTFSFTSQNILFKPGEWSLAGILLIKMLSLKSKKIEKSFTKESASKYFTIILSSIGHRIEDLDEIIHWMTCVNIQS